MTERPPHPTRVGVLHSLRTRVVVGTVLLLLVSLGGAVLAIRQALLVRMDEGIEQELAQEIEELRGLSEGNDPDTGQPFGDDVSAIFRVFMERNVPARDEAFYTFVDGTTLFLPFDAPVDILDDAPVVERWTTSEVPLRLDLDTADGEARTLAVPVLGADGGVRGTFVVAIYAASDRAEVDEVVRSVAIVTGLALLVTAAGAWLVAGRVLQPVRELTVAARQIDAGDLTRRIDVRGGDEMSELAATFNGMLDRLDDAFRSQRAFLDDVAHELRTPITIARGHLELLGDEPEQRAETVEIVTDELDRMSRYVDDLLVVAKSAQPDFLQLGVVDVAQLVDDVLARSVALGDRAWVRGAGPGAAEVLVLADEGRLTQALLALVTNAVQHTSEGDRIEVGAVVGERVRLYVADSGPGVEPDERERLFARFSRGAHGATRRPEGTGLGLAIVAAIAAAHRGTVGVDSEPGEGATFYVEIPRTSMEDP